MGADLVLAYEWWHEDTTPNFDAATRHLAELTPAGLLGRLGDDEAMDDAASTFRFGREQPTERGFAERWPQIRAMLEDDFRQLREGFDGSARGIRVLAGGPGGVQVIVGGGTTVGDPPADEETIIRLQLSGVFDALRAR